MEQLTLFINIKLIYLKRGVIYMDLAILWLVPAAYFIHILEESPDSCLGHGNIWRPKHLTSS